MSSPDPEETPRPETPRRSDDAARSPGSADARRFELPEDIDAAFAAIVAEWAGTDAPRWPQVPPARRDAPDEHFVPPEPPPLPRIGLSSLLGLLLLVAGVVLLALPALAGGGLAGFGIVPGLLAMAAGLGWLVVGMRRSSDDDRTAGPDEGGTL